MTAGATGLPQGQEGTLLEVGLLCLRHLLVYIPACTYNVQQFYLSFQLCFAHNHHINIGHFERHGTGYF